MERGGRQRIGTNVSLWGDIAVNKKSLDKDTRALRNESRHPEFISVLHILTMGMSVSGSTYSLSTCQPFLR